MMNPLSVATCYGLPWKRVDRTVVNECQTYLFTVKTRYHGNVLRIVLHDAHTFACSSAIKYL